LEAQGDQEVPSKSDRLDPMTLRLIQR